jgi:hypothetical protein
MAYSNQYSWGLPTTGGSTNLPGGATQPAQYTDELIRMINQLVSGGTGSGATTAGQLAGVLGAKPQTVNAEQVTQGTLSSADSIFKQLMAQNPELANQIGLTSQTTTLGGASSTLENYWKRIAGDSAASVLGAGATGADSLMGYIPGMVTGEAVKYQGQQEQYLANLLGLSTSMGNTAVNTGANIWGNYANQQNNSANNYNSLLTQAFGIGQNDYNSKSNAVLQAILNSSLDDRQGYQTVPFTDMTGNNFTIGSNTPSGGMGFTPSGSGGVDLTARFNSAFGSKSTNTNGSGSWNGDVNFDM